MDIKPITTNKEYRLRSWEKYVDLPSMLPNQLLYRFDTEEQGCLRTTFSTRGQYLAMACTMQKG